ncbi:unnamed protein product [Citrullus colocynthis]|uniref:Glycosyltransferase N-terminal domain-containing protein n=1 Tax=Citrullus colocynthis TaxID=252529 RepID=A0ABP0XN64_9ROSI
MGSHRNNVDDEGRGVHIVVVPSPAQGHINPLLQFSKHLAARPGLTLTFPTIFTDAAAVHLPATIPSLTLQQVPVSPYDGTKPETPIGFWERTQTSFRLHIVELISRHESDGDRVACVVFLTDQFLHLNNADWIFINTFDSLEPQEAEWMGQQLPFKSIGPMLPSIYLDGRLQDDTCYGLSLLESNMDSTMNWLHYKHNASVVYVSFGSLAEAIMEQIEELAMALKLSNRFFLWVVRESEIHKLPPNFIEDTSEKGLVVNWCPQLQVLGHKSVGCFITHCGWNSMLEALSLGVPLVAMAQWSDQLTNASMWKMYGRLGRG